ncbi:MAG TPA: dienelactone hydrolase family protein [Methylomirabilota bacterium]|jgi:dienelactone hydrolase|nr:dienelactone hydrolase family protein [Methylomirabilota bacterium]
MAGPRGGLFVGVLAALLAACAGPASERVVVTSAPDGARDEIPVVIDKPEGPGPFPAVVILHDCSGLGPWSSGAPARWARELGARGYVTVIPDSFTTRGHPDGVCTHTSPNRGEVAPSRRVHDAYAALAHVRALPYVDGRRVGLMGGSHGGSTTLVSIAAPEQGWDPLARDKRAGFAAAVALYPGCAIPLGGWRPDGTGTYRPVAPLLILIGEKDDWTPAPPCVKLAASARATEHPVAITVYPGALHSFDSDRPVRFVAARVNSNAPGGRGATTGGDATAWADSIRRVTEFFGAHLKP